MLNISLLQWLFYGLPECIILISLAVALANNVLEWKKIFPIGLLHAIIALSIRKLPIIFGLHSIVLMTCLVLFLCLFLKVSYNKAIKSVLLAYIILFTVEISVVNIVTKIFPVIENHFVDSVFIRIAVGFPILAILFLITLFIDYRNNINNTYQEIS